MEQHEQERFDQLYAKHLQALKPQGKRGKTIDGYSKAVRRIAGYFNRCPGNLTAAVTIQGSGRAAARVHACSPTSERATGLLLLLNSGIRQQ